MSEPLTVFEPPPLQHRPWQIALAVVLFLATLLAATTLGAIWSVATHTEDSTDLAFVLSARGVQTVWGDPSLLAAGFSFSIPLLFILLAHELGHYIPCRRYRLPTTPPYFLPVPFGLGTLGAFIKIKHPIRNRRELLVVGAGGPIAGFLALLPFLLIGIAKSTPASYEASSLETANAWLFLPGKSLASELVAWLFHGAAMEGAVLNLHPFALAAWVGLLATSLNLLPLAQLDGGHILYAMAGRLQHRFALPLWVALALCGFFWFGWLIWCLIVLAIGLKHPPVMDEAVALESHHRLIGWIAAVIFALSFMPVPLDAIAVR